MWQSYVPQATVAIQAALPHLRDLQTDTPPL